MKEITIKEIMSGKAKDGVYIFREPGLEIEKHCDQEDCEKEFQFPKIDYFFSVGRRVIGRLDLEDEEKEKKFKKFLEKTFIEAVKEYVYAQDEKENERGIE